MAHDSALELGYFPLHNPIVPTKPDAKVHDLDRGMLCHELISDSELRVSSENGELI
jgi:hypothetical protein